MQKLTLLDWRGIIRKINGDLNEINRLDKKTDLCVKDNELVMNEECVEALMILKQVGALKQNLDNLEEEIKDNLLYLMNDNVKVYEDDKMVIKCTWTKKNKKYFNSAAFKKDHPDLYAQYEEEKDCNGYVNIYWKD